MFELDPRERLYLVLAATFCTCLVTGDIIGGKLVSFSLLGASFTTTVGMIPFPVTFLLTDVINEFYGERAARSVTWLGFGMAALAFTIILVAGAVPFAEFTKEPGFDGVTEEAFGTVFLGSLRMLAASLVAYLLAQFVDIFVFHALRRWTSSKHLWLRATGSTAISQLVDTLAITFVAWSGVLPIGRIFEIVYSAYGLKLLIAVSLTPLLYLVHGGIERSLGIRPVALSALRSPSDSVLRSRTDAR